MRWPCWLGHDWGRWVLLSENRVQTADRFGALIQQYTYTRWFQRRTCNACGYTEERERP